MTKTFKYGILKYCHSPFGDEQLNLGLIFLFNSPGRLLFKFPRNFNRIKKLYKDFDEVAVKQYLIAFEKKAEELNESSLNDELDNIISEYFIVRDAAPLQFKNLSSVIQYTDDIENITKQYLKLYFPEVNPREVKKGVSDYQVSSEFRNLLLERDKSIRKFLDPPLELKNEKAHFKADLVWKNGSINAVKGVSFDLKENDAVTDKALLINAKLNYLSGDALSNNIRFDLIVKAPVDKKLFSAYESALNVLADIKANLEIITEEKLEKYIQRTLDEIERKH